MTTAPRCTEPVMETFKSTVATCVAVECLMLMDYLPGSKPPPLEEMVANELPNVLNAVVPDVHYHCADPAAYLESVTQKITDFEHATERISSRAYTGVTLSLLRFTKRGPTAAPEKVRDVAREVARILGAPDISKKVELAYEAVFCALVRAP